MRRKRNRDRTSPRTGTTSPSPPPSAGHPGRLRDLSLTVELFAGPLPHPDILAAYDLVSPGAAEMILANFEAQAAHRRRLEVQVVQGNITRAALGQIFGFSIMMLLIGSGTYLLHQGRDLGGLGTIVVAIVGAVTVFVTGKRSMAGSLEERRTEAIRR